jgi:NDP-sugar pyrophosphorylase family protein
MATINTAIILAAGLGTKIFPYNLTKQKSAIPIGNIPVVSHIVRDLLSCGIDKIYIVVNHLSEQIRALFRNDSVVFVAQKEPFGTADAVKSVLDQHELPENFLIVYGDICCAKENYESILSKFEAKGADLICTVKALEERDDPQSWICALVDPFEYTIQKIVGHPRGDVTHRFGGIFACNKTIVEYIINNPGSMKHVDPGVMSPIKNFELAESIQMMVEDDLMVHGVENSGFLVDLDKPWHILEANEKMLEYLAKNLKEDYISEDASISESADISGQIFLDDYAEIGNLVSVNGNLWLGKHSRLINGVTLEGNVVIGEDTIIKNHAIIGGPTTIGPKCRIRDFASFQGVCFERVYMVHYCEYAGVIGEGSDIGAATVCGNLRFDDQDQMHDVKGRKETEKRIEWVNHAFLGDYCRTGVNAIIMPGCKVGPYSIIGPGVLLNKRKIPEKTIILREDNNIEKEWGPERYGW